jgi:hypothetical protein
MGADSGFAGFWGGFEAFFSGIIGLLRHWKVSESRKGENCPKMAFLQRIVVLLLHNIHTNRVIHNFGGG